jgi:YebC/PmpR family DNA-binding regulatory protein
MDHRRNAGHSHWANIKHKKERSDLVKMATFGKLALSIKNAVRLAGPNAAENPLLAGYLDAARKAGYPKDKIQQAVRAGTGEGGEGGESVVYECRGGSAVLMIFALTDNKHRTSSNVRTIVHKNTDEIYKVGAPGCAASLFVREGVLEMQSDGRSKEEVMDAMLESNVEDFTVSGQTVTAIVEPNELKAVKDALAEQGLTHVTKAEIRYRPRGLVIEPDPGLLEKLLGLLLGDGDVVDVVHNVDLDKSWEKFEATNE